MIHEQVELHNVAEVQSLPGREGVRLQRVPEHVRQQLNESAQVRVRQPDGVEIRFRCDGPTCRVTLSSEGETGVTVFHGLFDSRQRFICGPQPQTFQIEMPAQLARLDAVHWSHMAFAPHVVRLILGGPQREPAFFHRVEGDGIRPPEPADLPALRHLAYGTSITHGFDAEGPHLTYAAQTARHLGADLINLGLGGAAHCEQAIADYIAGRDDWHLATLGLSVNMHDFPMEVFRERVSYLVNTIAGSDPDRVVACITLFTYFRDLGIDAVSPDSRCTSEQYRQALRDIVAACPHPNVHLLEGRRILTDIAGLTADLLHPGDNGMIEMGRNLAAMLRPLLPDTGERR